MSRTELVPSCFTKPLIVNTPYERIKLQTVEYDYTAHQGGIDLNSAWMLLIILVIGILSRNSILAAASGIVLVIGLLDLHRLYPLLERRGIEAGLLFLTTSVLIPFATGKISPGSLRDAVTSHIGLAAVIGGLTGAYLNAQGIDLIRCRPEIIPGILIGVILSVALFGGTAVGPVMAAGITSVIIALMGS